MKVNLTNLDRELVLALLVGILIMLAPGFLPYFVAVYLTVVGIVVVYLIVLGILGLMGSIASREEVGRISPRLPQPRE